MAGNRFCQETEEAILSALANHRQLLAESGVPDSDAGQVSEEIFNELMVPFYQKGGRLPPKLMSKAESLIETFG